MVWKSHKMLCMPSWSSQCKSLGFHAWFHVHSFKKAACHPYGIRQKKGLRHLPSLYSRASSCVVELRVIHLLGMLQSLAILSAEKANFGVLIETIFRADQIMQTAVLNGNPLRKRTSWRVTCVIRLTPASLEKPFFWNCLTLTSRFNRFDVMKSITAHDIRIYQEGQCMSTKFGSS